MAYIHYNFCAVHPCQHPCWVFYSDQIPLPTIQFSWILTCYLRCPMQVSRVIWVCPGGHRDITCMCTHPKHIETNSWNQPIRIKHRQKQKHMMTDPTSQPTHNYWCYCKNAQKNREEMVPSVLGLIIVDKVVTQLTCLIQYIWRGTLFLALFSPAAILYSQPIKPHILMNKKTIRSTM